MVLIIGQKFIYINRWILICQVNSNLIHIGTVYYRLNQHDKEIECYDKALEINPYLTEAKISKGLTIAKIYNKYNEALDILENVDDNNSGLSKRWPYFYYWISAIYLANNNLESALLSINKYILCKPDDKYGIYLKFKKLDIEQISICKSKNKQFSKSLQFYFGYSKEFNRHDAQVCML